MELNWFFYNSKATDVKNAGKIDFLSVKLIFCLWFLLNPKIVQIPNQQEKRIFPSISDMGCFRVQFQ
jgi:hypothetical protein